MALMNFSLFDKTIIYTGQEEARTAVIQEEAASGNSQTITPPSTIEWSASGVSKLKDHALHPWFLAWETQLARVGVDMYPLLASEVVAGLPMTSLLNGTPDAAIWKRAVCGQVELEVVRRPEQVVYSVVPSLATQNWMRVVR